MKLKQFKFATTALVVRIHLTNRFRKISLNMTFRTQNNGIDKILCIFAANLGKYLKFFEHYTTKYNYNSRDLKMEDFTISMNKIRTFYLKWRSSFVFVIIIFFLHLEDKCSFP